MTRPLKVVFLDHCAEPSGAELALLEVLPALASVAVDAEVILGGDGPLVTRFATITPTRVLTMPNALARVGRKGPSGLRDTTAAAAVAATFVLRLSRQLRLARPDLVHANSLRSGIYGLLAARLARVPLVWQIHDRLTTDYLSPSMLRVVRAVLHLRPALVVANSHTTATTLPKGSDVVVVNVPVAVSVRPRSVSPGLLTFGTLSRLSPWKGQHQFLRAFARAFPVGPEQAVVFGAPLFGEDGYARSLHELAAALGIGDRVRFAGHVEDAGAALAELDVLVHTPTIPEPFGRVVAEAMSVGLPVVAFAEGGPAEIIEHGRTGLLVPPQDADALVVALRQVAADPDLRERLAQAAPAAVAHLAPDRVAGRIRAAYDLALARPRHRSYGVSSRRRS